MRRDYTCVVKESERVAKRFRFRRCTVSVLAAALILGYSPDLLAQDSPTQPRPGWSTVGATGIVDESSRDNVVFYDTASAAIRRSLNSATVRLRYAIPNARQVWDENVPGTDDNANLCMFVSARDTGSAARVVVKLQEVHNFSGTVTTLVTWDSDVDETYFGERFETQGDTSYRPGLACLGIHNGVFRRALDGWNNAYFVEVTMSKSASDGNPGIKLIKLQHYDY